MLQINVSQQLKSPIGTTREYEINGIIAMDDYDNTVQGIVRLMRTDTGIMVKGTIETSGKQTCGRCLGTFTSAAVLKIEEEYFPTIDVVSGEARTPDEPDSFTINSNNILDLTEALRQYSILVRPMKPLCSDECAGLCPTCGANLNQYQCDCPRQPVDSRWAKLNQLVLSKTELSPEEEKGKE